MSIPALPAAARDPPALLALTAGALLQLSENGTWLTRAVMAPRR
jgi:hypothetical protein